MSNLVLQFWLASIFFSFYGLAYSASPAQKAQEPAPFIESQVRSLIQVIQDNEELEQKDIKAFRKLILNKLIQFFDVPRMTKSIAGKYYKRMSDAQLERLSNILIDYISVNYTSSLSAIVRNETPKLSFIELSLPKSKRKGKRAAVKMLLKQPSNDNTITFIFSLKYQKDRWVASNLSVNKINLILHYRSMFYNLVSLPQHKGDLDLTLTTWKKQTEDSVVD